jgi:hypothetical protein
MPLRSNPGPSSSTDSSADLRQQAGRARRLAADMTTERDRVKLVEFAEELEARSASGEIALPRAQE